MHLFKFYTSNIRVNLRKWHNGRFWAPVLASQYKALVSEIHSIELYMYNNETILNSNLRALCPFRSLQSFSLSTRKESQKQCLLQFSFALNCLLNYVLHGCFIISTCICINIFRHCSMSGKIASRHKPQTKILSYFYYTTLMKYCKN